MRGPPGAGGAGKRTVSTDGTPPRLHPLRMVGIGSAIAIMVALILLLGSVIGDGGERVRHPSPGPGAPAGEPIPAEADVFRLRPGDLATPAGEARRPAAHPRSLAMYRRLRAYPGAPPRIPHGLTKDEFRESRCNTCHRRGGYVERFRSHAPITPHPELGGCLQCHAPDDTRVGIDFPGPGRTSACGQCHADPDAERPVYAPLDWRPPPGPELGRQALPESPPAIPHDPHFRGMCLACHAGPAAVAEIRTDHPERVMCRGCHVSGAATGRAPADDAFTPSPGRTGGGP